MTAFTSPSIRLSGLSTESGSFARPYSEPCTWSAVLDNTEGEYGFFSTLANPRTYDGVFNVQVEIGDQAWSTPDLVLKSFDFKLGNIVVGGKCKLDWMDRKSQNIIVDPLTQSHTVRNMPMNVVLDLIAAHCGLTVDGAPTRNVVEWHLAGINPLEEFRKLLDPTHVFYMGVGNTIVVESATTHAHTASLKDDYDLELLEFSRTDEIENRATVERIVPEVGRVVLFDQEGSGGDQIEATNGPHPLSEPSRELVFEIKEALRGQIVGIVLRGEDGEPVHGGMWTQPSYSGTTPVHSFTFIYQVAPLADAWPGPWTPQWRIRITGRGLDQAPIPLEGYSETRSAGAGDHPYDEPFSSASINNAAEAAEMAQALVDRGTRSGNAMQLRTMATVDLARSTPNGTVVVTDWLAAIGGLNCVLELLTLTWSASPTGDTGTLAWDLTWSEEE